MSAQPQPFDQAGFAFKPGDVVVVINYPFDAPVLRRVIRCVIQYTGTPAFGERYYSVAPLGRGTLEDVLNVPERLLNPCPVSSTPPRRTSKDISLKATDPPPPQDQEPLAMSETSPQPIMRDSPNYLAGHSDGIQEALNASRCLIDAAFELRPGERLSFSVEPIGDDLADGSYVAALMPISAPGPMCLCEDGADAAGSVVLVTAQKIDGRFQWMPRGAGTHRIISESLFETGLPHGVWRHMEVSPSNPTLRLERLLPNRGVQTTLTLKP